MQKFVSNIEVKENLSNTLQLSMKENDSNTLQCHLYTYRFHMCMALPGDSTYSKHSIAENFVINLQARMSNKSINNSR